MYVQKGGYILFPLMGKRRRYGHFYRGWLDLRFMLAVRRGDLTDISCSGIADYANRLREKG